MITGVRFVGEEYLLKMSHKKLEKGISVRVSGKLVMVENEGRYAFIIESDGIIIKEERQNEPMDEETKKEALKEVRMG